MRRRLSLLILFLVITGSGVILPPTKAANAANSNDWNAGLIMDDSIFTDKNSMSVSQIQDFLNRQVPNCDTNGTQRSELGGGTRAQYGAANGNPAPFTCLRDYYEVPKTTPGPNLPANNYGGKPIPDGAQSAAQLIWNASQRYNISPKVLLVKIATESAGPLTSDNWPFLRQYTYAMGSNCPDSGPNGSANCDVNYSGFSMQIDSAASLMRWYLDSMSQPWWSYKKPNQVNSILWNVAPSECGAGNVYIQSSATAALYTYTPYQPNQAALNNLYGTGDNCSAYGNRNFWRVFSDWFGPTQNQPYSWTNLGQSAYKDQSLASSIGLPATVKAGDRVYLTIVAKNTGTSTWKNDGSNPMRLGTSSPNDRQSVFCTNSGWINCGRPAQLTQSEVKPGEFGTFGFWVTAPSRAGNYSENFNLVVEGVTWMQGQAITFNLNVIDSYNWRPTSLIYYKDAAHSQPINNDKLVVNSKYYAQMTVQNQGNTTWNNSSSSPIRLATSNPRGSSSSLCSTEWISCDRLTQLKEASVAPGATGTFDFTINTGSQSGYTGQATEIVIDGQRWTDSNYTMWIKTNPQSYTWAYSGTKYYTDASKTQSTSLNSSRGRPVYVQLSVVNTGNTEWTNSGPTPVKLGTYGPQDRSSSLYSQNWEKFNRPAALTQANVKPGEIGVFEFWFNPPNSGTFNEYFNLVVENEVWMKDMGLLYRS